MNQLICDTVIDLVYAAKAILTAYPDQRVFALSGPMGAGKTTFIKEFCQQLNVADTVNSPTFSIVNEYQTTDGLSVFHFDFYRIEKAEELMDIGYEDYFYSGFYCFIEWPEKFKQLLPVNSVYISIEIAENDDARIISFL